MEAARVTQLLHQVVEEARLEIDTPWPIIHQRIVERQGRGGTPRRWPLAATLAVPTGALLLALAASLVALGERPPAVSAEPLVSRMQVAEAVIGAQATPSGACGPGAGLPTASASKEQLLNDVTDRLGQALGIRGDQVRAALRQTLVAAGPATPGAGPADVVGRLAQALHVSPDQVRQAFADPACNGRVVLRFTHGPNGAPDAAEVARLGRAAQVLGVTPAQLASSLSQVLAVPPAASDATLVNRLAQLLGVAPDRLQAALQQVGMALGPNGSFRVVVRRASPGQPK
ncbi:MAG TPA: hypothetical protein VII06_35565 [Chloroflexota bacterium]|jgi:hypothetical protein